MIQSMKVFSILAAVLAFAACAHSPVVTDSAPAEAAKNVNQEPVIAMWSSTVKDKSNGFDVSFNIRNLNQQRGILISPNDMTCKRGNLSGELKPSGTYASGKVIAFQPGQTKSINILCRLASRTSGDYVISIAKVYDGSKSAGKTSHPVVATGLDWHLVDAGSPK